MTLKQLSFVKQWQVRHHRPIELHTWDAVLTLWLMGWLGAGVELVLARPFAMAAFTLLLLAPGAYVDLRRRLHLTGRVRCDWLCALKR